MPDALISSLPPLYIDLNGTLIKRNLLFESLVFRRCTPLESSWIDLEVDAADRAALPVSSDPETRSALTCCWLLLCAAWVARLSRMLAGHGGGVVASFSLCTGL
jgi:hypothetical protein